MKFKIIFTAFTFLLILEQGVFAGDNNSDSQEKISTSTRLSIFDFGFDLAGLMSKPMDLNFSFGLLPRTYFPDYNFSLTPVFAFYDTAYKFYDNPEHPYVRDIHMIDVGGMFTYYFDQSGINAMIDFLYTQPQKEYPDSHRVKNLDLKLSFSYFRSTKYENFYYMSSGWDFLAEVSYFYASASAFNIMATQNYDLFCSNYINRLRAWRLINSFTVNAKSIFPEWDVSDYIMSRYCLSSMFAAYPGVCDINRLSILTREMVTVISPYFSSENLAWYSSVFFEIGIGLFGNVGSADYSGGVFRFSCSFETGFRLKGLANLYVRFTYFYPENPSIKSDYFISVSVG